MDINTLIRLARKNGAVRLASIAVAAQIEEMMDANFIPAATRDEAYWYGDRKYTGKWARAMRARSSKLQKNTRKGK